METRKYEVRAAKAPRTLEGIAAVYDSPTKYGDVTETIAAGAFADADISDVVLLTNHDGGAIPLARTPKTLTLEVTERGLEMKAELPDTEHGRAVYEAVKRGDLSQMSFAFDIKEFTFDEETQTRTITAIAKVYEISVVNFAAYKETSVQARNDEQKEAQEAQKVEATKMNNPIIEGLEKKATNPDSHATPEYRAAFFKKLLNKELSDAESRAFDLAKAEKRADAFNTLSNAAAVIPTQTLDEIISQARPVGGLFNEIRLFNVPSNLAVPVGTPGDAAAWHTEGATVDRRDATVASVTFAGRELIKVMSMSAAVQRMSVSAFEKYIADELKASVTDAINAAIVNGTGGGQPSGIMGITWTDGVNAVAATGASGAAIMPDDLLNAVALLPAGYGAGAKFAMSSATLFGKIYPLKDATGNYLFTDTEAGGVRRLFGFEIVVDDNIPPNTVLFGNFKFYGVNVPEGVAIEASRESGFTSGLVDFRALTICDGKPIVPGAFVKIYVEE